MNKYIVNFLILGTDTIAILNNDIRSYSIDIEIIDDDLIEPFEFFTIDIFPDKNSSKKFPPRQKVVYIQDNDCKF